MTSLNREVFQDYGQDRRVTLVLAPRVTMLAQDVVDTLRIEEESFQGLAHPRLIDASGKQDLGGGKFVGITYALQNNQLMFEDRDAPVYSGTITTTSPTAVGGRLKVIDSAASFVTDNVERGSFIINWTDKSIVSVQQVNSPSELEVRVPTGGTTNTYTLNDEISVFNVEVVDVSGGNATAVDENGSPIDVVVPSVGTYVLLTLSTSASLVDQGSPWDALRADHTVAGSFGEYVGKKLLSVSKFLGLK